MKSKPEPLAGTDPWYLYILQCHDGKFYTGITKDISRRLKRHNAGKGASFTRARLPVKIIYQETLIGRTEALLRELAVKSLPRKKKEELVAFHTKPRRKKGGPIPVK